MTLKAKKTMYVAQMHSWGDNIQKRPVFRETDKTVWVYTNGKIYLSECPSKDKLRRCSKQTEYEVYCDTLDDAKKEICKHFDAKYKKALEALECADNEKSKVYKKMMLLKDSEVK